MNQLSQVFGTVTEPTTNLGTDAGTAIGKVIQFAIWFLIIGAALYALFNLILAGYDFMSAGDDPKKVASAWAKIWQTLLGLTFTAGAFVLAAIFGYLLFGSAYFILQPTLPTL